MLFNFVILSFANKVGNAGATHRRLLIASFVGALPVTLFPASFIVVIVSFLVMTVYAFGRVFESWKKSASIVLVGALFAGGMLTAFQYRIHAIVGSYTVLTYAVLAYVSLYFFKKNWLDVRTVRRLSELSAKTNLQIWGENFRLDIFVDTGNSCTEPLSGAPVHFVALKAIENLMPDELKGPLMVWNPNESTSLSEFPSIYQKDMRLVRLQTVEGPSWAIGFKFEKWMLEGDNALHPGYIVLTKSSQHYPAGADAILHVSAMETLNLERGAVHAA